jgi:site-specific DNA recombinase
LQAPRGTEVTLSILRDGHEQQVRARLTSLFESSALVGEIKKGRYVFYHCTGYNGKCPEPYTREQMLEKAFAELLRGISFSEEAMGWVSHALRMGHSDEKKFQGEAILRLRREHKCIQNRIDEMYMDKLDGRIDAEFFDRKTAEWRTKQIRVL